MGGGHNGRGRSGNKPHVVDMNKTKTKRNQNKYIVYSRSSILASFGIGIKNIFSKTTETILIKSYMITPVDASYL